MAILLCFTVSSRQSCSVSGPAVLICPTVLQANTMIPSLKHSSMLSSYIKNMFEEFIDICSMANITVAILVLENYGFYIHVLHHSSTVR